MSNGFKVPVPINEPIKDYAPNSEEKKSLVVKLNELSSKKVEIPIIIDGKEIKTGNTGNCIKPYDHAHILGTYHKAGEKEVKMAIESSLDAWNDWSQTSFEFRAKIFLKMADLLAGPYRDTINASTMLNMSKNAYQAEIDAACELIDFWNFNCYYADEIYKQQPMYSPEGTKNQTEHRPLEGFVFAVTPFNFTSIAANLPSAPALMGNTAIWKPASSTVYPAHFMMKLFKEAGLPDGVINLLPGSGAVVGNQILAHPKLAGIHFTGSTGVFQGMWKHIGENINHYESYPRIVGETGGKDFCIAHESCNKQALATAMTRGAFEFQGQKCSAMSRAYIPSTIWNDVKKMYFTQINELKMGSPEHFSNFINSVIDQNAFDSITSYIDYAKDSDDAEIITGGQYDDSKGYFIEPTTILTTNPHFKTMEEEIFGPVLTIFIYSPEDWDETLRLVDTTSPYALTGAIFCNDKEILQSANKKLRFSAGNYYINDKPTGAVVGQQPFGGARASGTNDKAGSMFNLIRWVSQRTIKENFEPPTDYKYPFMGEDE
ncbi:MAG: 1-pyrroline-5-carboxylate dehydrogenase [Candidatus Marinimicrobia bacterium]|nr:1-pyrroline-5-carboxylate dehydrogenase [Candidatus Neomarinimicrobiota bacterium]|tara:strand:+ start:5726 stop:7360 length:1635 start_codon:yes stop_codon:yes gene_type:complete